MGEQFNRRISEVLKVKRAVSQSGNKFNNRAERKIYIQNFVDNYHRTKLACIECNGTNTQTQKL